MPRSGRKNPTPKRVARRTVECSEVDASDEGKPQEALENAPIGNAEILQSSIISEMLTLPEDPDELVEILKRMPIEALYKENDVSGISFVTMPNDNGEYLCRKCNKAYRSASGLRYHVSNVCGPSSKCRFTCLVCGAEYVRHQEVLNHVSYIHLSSEDSYNTRRATKTTAKTTSWEEDTPNSSQDDDSVETAKEEYVPNEKGIANAPSEINRQQLTNMKYKKKGLNVDKSTFGTIEHPFHDVMPWMYHYVQGLEEKFGVVHLNITQSFDGLIPDSRFDLSKIRRSPPFQITTENKKKDSTEHEGLPPLTGLESKCENTYTMNAGGPVWALSWCPTPLRDFSCRQYLAVSVHAGVHSISSSYYEPGLIQLWDCGILRLHNSENETPKLSYALSINDAPIWDLKWCPIGGKIISMNEKKSDARLGILAAACASGKVFIFAIPPANEVRKFESLIYKAKPALSLLPTWGNKSDIERLFGQCMCVDWTLSDGGEWIAGGYCKGLVAIWKVKDISPLVLNKSTESGELELTACRTFHAHNKVVRSLCWCPYDEDVLATAGFDRFIKFWNKGYTEAPVLQTQVKGSLYTEITWPVLWCGVYASTEEAFAASFNHGLSFHDLMLRNPTTLIPFKSVCWSVSCSNWMNCAVGGDAMGQTILFACSNWSRKARLAKGTFPRMLVFSSEVKWPPSDDKQMDTDDDFSNSESTYKLIFHDTNFGNMKNTDKRACCKKVRLQETYPETACQKPMVQSVNRVSWNPNFGSHTWIASGMHCGLVRLHCVDVMHSEEMDNHIDILSGTISNA